MKIIGWLLPLLPLLAAGCGGEKQTVRAAEIFGTRITLIVSGMAEERAAAAIGDSFAHMETMHRRFHAWREGELLRVNRAIAAAALPMTVSAPMAAMITLAADCERRAEGLFAPAAGALFSLWGAHNNPPSRPPSAEKIAAHLPPRECKTRGCRGGLCCRRRGGWILAALPRARRWTTFGGGFAPAAFKTRCLTSAATLWRWK